MEYSMGPTYGMTSTIREDRSRLRIGSERTILASIYNRIAIDVAAVSLVHARVDQNGKFQERIQSELASCLSLSANIDQTAREFIMDAVLSMFDEGVVALVPVDTTIDITSSGAFDILSLRTGKITQWMPEHIRAEVYNERTGRREELTLPKSSVCIVENPLYQVMNEPNSNLQRLKYKLSLLDATDDKQNSDKLNLIIQLPYTIKSSSKMEQAEQRRKQIEMQLVDSKYGIAYIDGTEKVTQLGHPIENKLLEEIQYLTDQLYAQLGMTPEVFNGTADERVMLNYYNRTLEPILAAITDEMKRKFLTKTARTQGQSIVYIRDPFRLAPAEQLAEIAERFTRNEIVTSNEFRAILGFEPSTEPRADQLLNKNINPVADDPMYQQQMGLVDAGSEVIDQNGNALAEQTGEVDIDSMTDEEKQQYLAQLEAFQEELDELERQANLA